MDEIGGYAIAHSCPETGALEWIRRQTNLRTSHAHMLSGPVQGAFLTILAQAVGARRALEIGTFTGYSSTCIALGMPDGHLDTIEVNDELLDLIREGWRRAGVSDRITLHPGNAVEVMKSLPAESFDLAYIDGNKREYRAYWEGALRLVRPGGVIIADNTLWGGKVLQRPLPVDAQTTEMAAFNDSVASDSRVLAALLPIRDGITVALKKK